MRENNFYSLIFLRNTDDADLDRFSQIILRFLLATNARIMSAFNYIFFKKKLLCF